ncbi:nuclear transport factor 2 family protein [Thalassotalea litorea]|uniref:nuclear transport factor 2 family protein n=1 Tax=Thalassotalea litorea TaxID=2020715 RepID=UPI003735DDBA
MRNMLLALTMIFTCVNVNAESVVERNKSLAKNFYQDLWFTNNTEKYTDYVADAYVVHDVGPRKGIKEQAIAQKEIADMFHSFGKMTGKIDYQIAEDDKVATRWLLYFEPNDEAKAKGMTEIDGVAIINVFRFNNEGKIVEFWNHRHDVELPRPPEMQSDTP